MRTAGAFESHHAMVRAHNVEDVHAGAEVLGLFKTGATQT